MRVATVAPACWMVPYGLAGGRNGGAAGYSFDVDGVICISG